MKHSLAPSTCLFSVIVYFFIKYSWYSLFCCLFLPVFSFIFFRDGRLFLVESFRVKNFTSYRLNTCIYFFFLYEFLVFLTAVSFQRFLPLRSFTVLNFTWQGFYLLVVGIFNKKKSMDKCRLGVYGYGHKSHFCSTFLFLSIIFSASFHPTIIFHFTLDKSKSKPPFFFC